MKPLWFMAAGAALGVIAPVFALPVTLPVGMVIVKAGGNAQTIGPTAIIGIQAGGGAVMGYLAYLLLR